MSRRLIWGVDAGGTKTKVLLGEVVEGQLRTIGEATGAAGNPRSVGFDSALHAIETTVRQAYTNAGIDFIAAASSCLSVAGAGRPEERRRILQWCSEKGLAVQSVAVGDAECLLAAVSGQSVDGQFVVGQFVDDQLVDEPSIGIALIAGTGSMAWGRSESGETARAGGLGYLFDDEGSGYWIAARALNHVGKSGDGRKGWSSLTNAILGHLRMRDPQELVRWCYESKDPRVQVASLAPIVFDQYAEDAAAKAIIEEGARSLASLVVAVASRLGMGQVPTTLACSGSVLIHQPRYRELLSGELACQSISAGELQVVPDPAVGALRIAWNHQ